MNRAMASSTRACRPFNQLTTILRQRGSQSYRLPSAPAKLFPTRTAVNLRAFPHAASSFHTTTPHQSSGQVPPTDFEALDVLGNTPVPSTSVDVCMSDGFQLNSGVKILDGSGVLLVGGEAFAWRPWLARGEKRLLNKKGQWEVPNETFGLFGLLWPRPGT